MNESIKAFNKICQDFLANEIRIEAQEEIEWHKDQQNEVVIISPSIENWIKSWALILELKCIGYQNRS